MALNPRDIEKIRQMFEDGLKRVSSLDKIERMKMRGKIRREISLISSWKSPKADVILNRWESRLSDLFSLFPKRFRDDLLYLLSDVVEKE